MRETLVWAALFAVALAAGLLFRRQTSTLGSEIFGANHRLRYVYRDWVLDGIVSGRRIRYNNPGRTNFGPAWASWLFVEAPVAANVMITKDSELGDLALAAKPLVASLKQADGFDRLELFGKGPRSRVNTMGTVSWLDAGPGITLRRITKHGDDAQFVKNDIALLLKIVGVLQQKA